MGRSLSHVRARATIVEAPLVRTNSISMVVNIAFIKNQQKALNAQIGVERGEEMQQSNGDWKGRGQEGGTGE